MLLTLIQAVQACRQGQVDGLLVFSGWNAIELGESASIKCGMILIHQVQVCIAGNFTGQKTIQWLRDYYFMGAERPWNNEFLAWTTGEPWDVQFNEINFYIVPETYALLQTLRGSFRQAARKIDLHKDFWSWSLVERRAWFIKEVMGNYMPSEILPCDLIAGGRFNVQTSLCLKKKEQKKFDQAVLGKGGARAKMKWFHDHGYGNTGATSGHLIPDPSASSCHRLERNLR